MMSILLGPARFWLLTARAPFLGASLLSVLLGAAVAAAGAVEAPGAGAATSGGAPGSAGPSALGGLGVGLALAGVALAHLGINLANDYFDHLQGSDWVNRRRTKYNGGSGMIQAGLVRPGQVAGAAVIALAAAGAIGAWLAAMTGPLVWWLMAAGLVLGVGYSAPPLALMNTGWGELAAGLACGPLVAWGAYHVAGGRQPWLALAAAAPVGLLVSAILVLNEVPDYQADRATGKRNLVVRWGQGAGLALHRGLVLGAYACIAGLAAAGWLPASGLAALATAPLAWRVLGLARRGGSGDPAALESASGGTAALQALVAAALAVSFWSRW